MMKEKPTILIVDDEPLNLKLIDVQLPKEQYDTILASDGASALEKVKTEPPDLILLDIMMPGMNGWEVTRRLKGDPETADIPVVLVTALDGDEDKIKGLEAGADEFLNKPINASELLTRVRSLLRLNLYRDQLKARNRSKDMVAAPCSQDGAIQTAADLPTILVVEDDENEVRLIKSYLKGVAHRMEEAKTGEEALLLAKKKDVDLILLDILLPGIDGFEVIRRIKEREEAGNVQIVAMTSLPDMEHKIQGIELGADEYLIKPINKYELKARIRSLIKKKVYLDSVRRDYETAVDSAITDRLTGLYNHAYFEHFTALELKRADRRKTSVALILIDIDDFKLYNDTFGHLTGDRILRELGMLLKENIREIDTGARYGGEEFAIVLPGADQKEAVLVAERILCLISSHQFLPDAVQPLRDLTVSMGISVYPQEALSLVSLVDTADKMLYEAKRKGKNRVHFLIEESRQPGMHAALKGKTLAE